MSRGLGDVYKRQGRDRVPIRIEARVEREVEKPSGSDGRRKQVRRMKITKKVLEKTGFTEGCEGCRYMQAGMDEQREHSEKCRQRIEEELAKTEEGQRRIKAQESRNRREKRRRKEEKRRRFRRKELREEKERSREQERRGRCRA